MERQTTISNLFPLENRLCNVTQPELNWSRVEIQRPLAFRERMRAIERRPLSLWERVRVRAVLQASLALAACILIAAAAIGQEKKPSLVSDSATLSASGTSISAEQAIRQTLQQKHNFGFAKLSLAGVVENLKEITKLEIQLDLKAISDIGINPETPITYSSQGTTIQTALKLILRPLNLTWIIEDDVLIITSTEVAESHLVTKVYAVHDLVAPKPSYPYGGASASDETNNLNMGGRGGMGGGMGGMGGGMGGMGGGMGMFNVKDDLQPANAPAVSSPLMHVLPQMSPQPATKPAEAGGEAKPSEPQKPAGAAAHSGGANAPGSQGMGGGMSSGPFGPRNRPSPRGPRDSSQASNLSIDMEDLIDTITSTVKPTTWDNVGGPGSISAMGGMLVISQTQEIHQEIETFLENFRASNPGLKVVSIRATWLLLNLKQVNQLATSNGKGGIDRKALEELAGKAKGYIGAISCLNGQTVHIVSGRSHSAVVGAIPVVGDAGWDAKGVGFEPLRTVRNSRDSEQWTVNAQVTESAGSNSRGVGYQPIMNSPLSGAVLQITPQLIPNTQSVLLDLSSSVTRPEISPEPIHFLGSDTLNGNKNGEEKSPARGGQSGMNLDRVNTVVGQLATTLIVPLGEPMLVGGLSREPLAEEQEAASTPQLYLFIEATAK